MNPDEIIKQATYPRSYLKQTTPSSLNPAIAYLMNYLSEMDKKDRLLDPCCGTGTILIERQLASPCICVGVDINPKTLGYAQANSAVAKVKIEFKHGDIQHTKLPEGYFTKIISNLPYGIHTGSRQQNIILYRSLAERIPDWLQVGGKVILLTQAKKILWNAFSTQSKLKFVKEVPIKIRGITPSIYIFERVVG